MKRYHKKVFFPNIKALKEINILLNYLNWKYSQHCLENLKYRVLNITPLLLYIKNMTLNWQDIFEYYQREDGKIEIICYRINWKEYDFILVLSRKKEIITIYINAKNDKHETLNKNLYCLS